MNARYDDMYQAASRYYVQGETMDAIAKQLGLSRSSVSRLLKEARETGLVRISLADEAGSRSPLAASIGRTFGVRVHLVAVREGVSEQRRFDQVARLAGRLFSEAVTDHCVIGVAWGVTSSLVVRYLQPKPLVDSIVVQMNGGTNQWSSGIPYVGEILQSVGDAFNSRVVYFPVPAFFDYAETKNAMWRERSVQNVIALQHRLDVVVFGVGCLKDACLRTCTPPGTWTTPTSCSCRPTAWWATWPRCCCARTAPGATSASTSEPRASTRPNWRGCRGGSAWWPTRPGRRRWSAHCAPAPPPIW